MDEPTKEVPEVNQKEWHAESNRWAKDYMIDDRIQRDPVVISTEDSANRTLELLKKVFDAAKAFFYNNPDQIKLALKASNSVKDMKELIESATEDQLRQLITVARSLHARAFVLPLMDEHKIKDRVSQKFMDDFPVIFAHANKNKEMNAEQDTTEDVQTDEIKYFLLGVRPPYKRENLIMESILFMKKTKDDKVNSEKHLKERLDKEIPWQTMETYLPSLCIRANDLTENFDKYDVNKIRDLLQRLAGDCYVVQEQLRDSISLIEREQNPTKHQKDLMASFEELENGIKDDVALIKLAELKKKVNNLF